MKKIINLIFLLSLSLSALSQTQPRANQVRNTPSGSISGTNVQSAIDELDTEKVPKTFTVNGHALSGNVTVTKTDVSLGNADNTSDAAKPVSTLQQIAIDAKVADALIDGVTTVAPSQNAVVDALTTTAKVLITGAIALDATAFGKEHVVSGTSVDYTVTLPTAVGNEGKMILFKGDPLVANFNKAVSIDGSGTETIDHRLLQLISTGGYCTIIARVTSGVGSWDVINFDQGSYISWTPTFVGFSGGSIDYRYKLSNRTLFITMVHITVGVGAGTTFTFSLPNGWTPNGNQKVWIQAYNNASTLSAGMISFFNATNVASGFTSALNAAWSGAGDREMTGNYSIQIN